MDFKTDNNPYSNLVKTITINSKDYKYFDLSTLGSNYDKLPFSIRVLLESAVRNCDNFQVTENDVKNIFNWQNNQTSNNGIEVAFKPARFILQDYTGLPVVVDFAAMREAVKALGGDPEKVNPLCPADLIIDHSVKVEYTRSPDAWNKNEDLELESNKERFTFLKWGAKAFDSMSVLPPGSGIMHQVNLEYLARVVFIGKDGILYPDTVVGTDSHTTMINGLGVLGWGVGGIEAEAVMLGQAISMLLPEVVGCKLIGKLSSYVTSTDLVLTITKNLRELGVVGKFVEFYGPGVTALSIADRATIANMSPEYGATVGYFPVDETALDYLRQTGRTDESIKIIEQYLRVTKQFRDYSNPNQDPVYTSSVTLDLSTVVVSVSGPKRPNDRVSVTNMKEDFNACLRNKVGFKGYGIPENRLKTTATFDFDGKEYKIGHGSVIIAAIASSTNTSNPSVMLGAGLLAKNAVEAGLTVAPYIKTSLSPGSKVVTSYLKASNVLPFLSALGFDVVGYGCMTCIGNSGPIAENIANAIESNDLVCCGVLSGNRNFEGRIHPNTRANYLASPLLVVAYAIAGTVDIDFEKEPLGISSSGNAVYLRDIWPTRETIQEYETKYVIPELFKEVYAKIETGSSAWQQLVAPEEKLYPWQNGSTYIKCPPFSDGITKELPPIKPVKNARVLLNLGDSITTDHICPSGTIGGTNPAARYLAGQGLSPKEFNSFGTRRGNHDVMVRGTFGNIRLVNKFMAQSGPKTLHLPTGEEMYVFDCAQKYAAEKIPLIILAGKDYGSGSSRDWAAKGPYLLGVKAVIAESFERIHRSNLVGMGIIPLQYLEGQNATSLGLTGFETFTIDLPKDCRPGQQITVHVDGQKSFNVTIRFDTEIDLTYYKHGGVLNYMVRKICA